MSMDLAKTFANQLFMLVKTAQIHDPANQAFQTPLAQIRDTVSKLFDSEETLRLEVVETNLYLNGEKLRTDISTFGTYQFFNADFESKNIGGLLFTYVPTDDDFIEFVRIYARLTDTTRMGAEEFNQALKAKEIHSIEFLERIEKKSVSRQTLPSRTVSQKRQALKNYVKAIDVIKDSASKITTAKGYESRKAKRVVYNLVDICLEEGFSFFGLSNVKNYDEYTFNHSVNVCVIAIAFGKNLGFTKKQIGELGIAALFHDYGKLAIPLKILNKPGHFDDDEWEVMKSHPIKSVKTMLALKGFQEQDLKKLIAAFEHHRNYDRSGYPKTGLNKPMNFYSKVVAIADAYDAMTTNRVYQRALLPTQALKILMDNAGTKFDPLLVKAFVNTVGIYPVGSLLQMNTGELAIVTAVTKDPDKLALPTIKIVKDVNGNVIQKGLEVNLAEQTSELKITEVVHPEDHGINVANILFGDASLGDTTSTPGSAIQGSQTTH